MSSSVSQPLAGRRIWIAGIGGAGMSAYALVARAWGAEVAGWDRVETPYLAHLAGIEVFAETLDNHANFSVGHDSGIHNVALKIEGAESEISTFGINLLHDSVDVAVFGLPLLVTLRVGLRIGRARNDDLAAF